MTDSSGGGLEPADPNDLPQVGNVSGIPAIMDAEGVELTSFAPSDEAEGISVEPVTQWDLFWARLRRHRLAMVSSIFLAVLMLIVILSVRLLASMVSGEVISKSPVGT